MTTYAEVAVVARDRWLIRLVQASAPDLKPPHFTAVFRSLDGVLLRLLRRYYRAPGISLIPVVHNCSPQNRIS